MSGNPLLLKNFLVESSIEPFNTYGRVATYVYMCLVYPESSWTLSKQRAERVLYFAAGYNLDGIGVGVDGLEVGGGDEDSGEA